MAISSYNDGSNLKKARKKIHNEAPGTFGIQEKKLSELDVDDSDMEIGTVGFDAPENVGFAVAGWLFGKGDFGRSICNVVAFGEDTECACSSLASTLGIIYGASNLPNEWTKPLDEKITTKWIDKTSGCVWIPKTVTELTDRILRNATMFLGLDYCDIFAEGGMTIKLNDKDELFCPKPNEYLPNIDLDGKKSEELTIPELCELSPYIARYSFPSFNVLIDYDASPFIKFGEPKRIRVTVTNSNQMHQQQWAKISCYMPNSVCMLTPKSTLLPLNNVNGAKAHAEFSFTADEFEGAKLEFLVDVSLEGRHSSGAVKVVLFRKF